MKIGFTLKPKNGNILDFEDQIKELEGIGASSAEIPLYELDVISGKIYIDNGASKALKNGKSLLSAGITKVEGAFSKGDNILIVDNDGKESARGLTSFSSEEINKIKGLKSDQIEKILGYSSKSEIVHRDDMVKL